MPNYLTNEEMLRRKQEIENKLNELENRPSQLDDLSDDDDDDKTETEDEKEDELNREVDDGDETEDEKEENFDFDFIKELEKEVENDENNSDNSDEEDEFEKKVNKVINKRQELKIFTDDIDILVDNLENYLEDIYSKLDEKKTITKGDLKYLEKDFKDIMEEFDTEYDNILNDMPKDLNLSKVYQKKIYKRLDKLENKCISFLN